jgi:hypothetical protein
MIARPGSITIGNPVGRTQSTSAATYSAGVTTVVPS